MGALLQPITNKSTETKFSVYMDHCHVRRLVKSRGACGQQIIYLLLFPLACIPPPPGLQVSWTGNTMGPRLLGGKTFNTDNSICTSFAMYFNIAA